MAVALDLASTVGGGVTTAVVIVDDIGVIVTAELTFGAGGVGVATALGGGAVGVGIVGLAVAEGGIKFCGGSGINPLKLAKISATLRRSV